MGMPLLVAGTTLQMLGQYGANIAQAQAELANAAFYREQADFTQFAKRRELSLISREYAAQYGAQVSAYAGGGVDLSGSAGAVVGATLARYAEESLAATKKYDLEAKLARLRGNQAEQTGRTLGSAGYNLMQGTTLAMSAYAGYSGSGNPAGSYGPMSPATGEG